MDGIQSAILKVFPKMENDLLAQLLEQVKELGGESAADLQFMEVDDFLGILKPIQARKLLKLVHVDEPKLEASSLSETDEASTSDAAELPGVVNIDSPEASISDETTQEIDDPLEDHVAETNARNSISDHDVEKVKSINVNNTPVHSVGKTWPAVYVFPENNLRPNILQELNQGVGKYNRVTKKAIIATLFDDMLMYKTYPTPDMYVMAAKSVICRYPFMQDTNPCSKPYDSWKLALSEKFRNERRNMKLPSVMKRKRSCSADTMPKRPMKNWTSTRPAGEDDVSISRHKVWLQTEVQKSRNINEDKVKHLMGLTFADRRKMIHDNKPIKEMKKEFPALFQVAQIHSEFSILVDVHDLEDTFTKNMKSILANVVEWPFSKKDDRDLAAKAKALSKEDKESDAFLTIGAFLLPRVVLENPNDLFVKGGQDFTESSAIPSMPTIIYSGDLFSASDYVIMAENEVICHPLSLYTSLLTLLATYYCFNLEYPQKTKRTLEFLQKVGLGLLDGNKLSPRVASVAAKLSRR